MYVTYIGITHIDTYIHKMFRSPKKFPQIDIFT